jgi:hypothetical protein
MGGGVFGLNSHKKTPAQQQRGRVFFCMGQREGYMPSRAVGVNWL